MYPFFIIEIAGEPISRERKKMPSHNILCRQWPNPLGDTARACGDSATGLAVASRVAVRLSWLEHFLYTYAVMFSQRVTLKKLLAATLSVCLLGMFLGCVTVCAEHLEASAAVDAHNLSEPCADEDCLVNASVASALPERSFLPPDDSVSQYPQVFHVDLISGGSALRSPLPSSLDPPLKLLCVMRI